MKETRLSFLESITFDGHILVAVPSKQENKSIIFMLNKNPLYCRIALLFKMITENKN